jgi:hypothetical protein
VDLEISPEPSPVEREALTIALQRLLAGQVLPQAYASGWRTVGIRENLDAEEDYATARPRSTPGARRA